MDQVLKQLPVDVPQNCWSWCAREYARIEMHIDNILEQTNVRPWADLVVLLQNVDLVERRFDEFLNTYESFLAYRASCDVCQTAMRMQQVKL